MKKSISLVLFILFSSILGVFGQIELTNVEKIAKIKNGTTYVTMKDISTKTAKEYIEIFKKYWTFSKIEFINHSERGEYFSETSSFLTFKALQVTKTTSSGMTYSNSNIYLELWTLGDKYFTASKRKRNRSVRFFGKELKNENGIINVARIELYTDFETLERPSNVFDFDYCGEGHIRNWGPGLVKNYVQALNSLLEKGKPHSLYNYIANKKKLKKLRKETLYIPDYLLIKFAKFSGDESERHEKNKLLKNYKYKHSFLSIDQLNSKILKDEEPFYYLVYVKSSTDKYMTVIDSRTGEIIYTKYKAVSYNASKKDFKILSQIISKS